MCSFSFSIVMIYICLIFIFTTLPSIISSNVILPEYENCHGPLGMESGSITDEDLTASSSHDISSVGPQMGRIRTELEGGAWCPEKPIGVNSYEYLQIEFRQLVFVNAIETQGRFGNGQGREYAEYYQIQYQRDNQTDDWITYMDKYTNKSILNGNLNTYLAEKRSLSVPIVAKRIRIVPHSTRWRTICMRVELYGCSFNGGVVSYRTSVSTDRDRTYDGGIGKLVDGIVGGDETCWLGWNSSPVSIQFQFDQLRHFKTIQIYTMNNKYSLIEVKFDNDRSFEHRPHPILSTISTVFLETIDLSQYGSMFISEQIELRFRFHNEIFLLTEIKFDNEIGTAPLFTSTLNTTTLCSTISTTNSSRLESSSLVIFTFEWLTIGLVGIFSLSFLLLFLIGFCHRRSRRRSTHRRLRQNSHLFSKSSAMTTTTSGSCVSTSSEHEANTLPINKMSNQRFLTNNYDDMTSEQQSMGSYIYPITSSTSLLQTTPPASIFKGEQYAVIDGNYSIHPYKHWSTSNTFHYASLDIGQISQVSLIRRLSLFDCILPIESNTSKCSHQVNRRFPSDVDQTKLMALRKLSETTRGEIYLGNYLVENQSECVLIKAIKSDSIESSRDEFLNELNILCQLNHQNLSCLIAVQTDLLYVVQEHSHFGTLQDYSRSLTLDTNFQKMNFYFAYQLASALQYLSQRNFHHGDVATRNCLFYSDLTIKLTDCAIALPQYRHEYWTNSSGQLIPLRWIAPEVLTNNATIHSDIYSFAVTLWEIWSRCSSLPFSSLTNEEIYQRFLLYGQNSSWNCQNNDSTIFYLSVPADCPKEIYDLFCECWHRDGTKRPNIDDITLYFRRQIDASRLNSNS